MYTAVGSLTHGSKFRLAQSDHETWTVVRHTEDYTFMVSDLDPTNREVLVGSSLGVWVNPEDKGRLWRLASEHGAWSIVPEYLTAQADDDLAVDLYIEERRS